MSLSKWDRLETALETQVEYSSQGVIALILFYALILIAVVLLPIITGVTLGLPNTQLKYAIQGTILSASDGV